VAASTKAEDAKAGARSAIDARRDDLIELSHRIHATPELGFEEECSSAWVAEVLDAAGFEVRKPAYDLPTAFVATAGHGPLTIAICAEYDALPSVGHACGHNIIASSAVGAALGLAGVVDDLGLTIQVIGTPAEERGDSSGKILLLERGAFDGVHAAMMVHPHPHDVLMPNMIAAGIFDAEYTGKEAHAAAWPELGINAADALTVAQVGIGLLRQHILMTDRIHGIVTKGGEAPNIVPAHTTGRFQVRSERIGELEALRARVIKCFEAGATATGAQLKIVGGQSPYAHVKHDVELAEIYRANAERLGRVFIDLGRASGSTDMGNVSQVVPSIHPFIGIDSSPAVNHQPEFTAACVRPAADRAVIDGAVSMAWTAIDIASNDGLRERLMTPREAARSDA
jgi:amidohydrolase